LACYNDGDANEDQDYEYFIRVVTWLPVILAVTVVCHTLLALLFFLLKIDIPLPLNFPRPEIMFGFFSSPILVMALVGIYDKGTSKLPSSKERA